MASAGIHAIRTPGGKRTCTGAVNELPMLPSPSWPSLPMPQAYRLPSVSSAYSVEFELPTSATTPGKVTPTGDTCWSFSAAAPPKKDPQCSTTDGPSTTCATGPWAAGVIRNSTTGSAAPWAVVAEDLTIGADDPLPAASAPERPPFALTVGT